MREIKFRAWDKQEKEWLNIKHFGFESNDLWYVQAIDSNERDMDPPYFVNSDDIELQQYTGLKDKKGKEIYEGDIVRGMSWLSAMKENWDGVPGEEQDIFEIRYDDASYKTFNQKGEWVAVLNHHVSSYAGRLEVIGNIYENPELLQE